MIGFAKWSVVIGVDKNYYKTALSTAVCQMWFVQERYLDAALGTISLFVYKVIEVNDITFRSD